MGRSEGLLRGGGRERRGRGGPLTGAAVDDTHVDAMGFTEHHALTRWGRVPHAWPMTTSNLPSESPQSKLPQLNDDALEVVTGGSTVLIPTEECPTCASGADPTVLDARFQGMLGSGT